MLIIGSIIAFVVSVLLARGINSLVKRGNSTRRLRGLLYFFLAVPFFIGSYYLGNYVVGKTIYNMINAKNIWTTIFEIILILLSINIFFIPIAFVLELKEYPKKWTLTVFFVLFLVFSVLFSAIKCQRLTEYNKKVTVK